MCCHKSNQGSIFVDSTRSFWEPYMLKTPKKAVIPELRPKLLVDRCGFEPKAQIHGSKTI
jgi:hypothetical protein